MTYTTFGIYETVISEGNGITEYIYFNTPGFLLARMKVPSEERVKQQAKYRRRYVQETGEDTSCVCFESTDV